MASIGEVLVQAVRTRDAERFRLAVAQAQGRGGDPRAVINAAVRRHSEDLALSDLRWLNERAAEYPKAQPDAMGDFWRAAAEMFAGWPR